MARERDLEMDTPSISDSKDVKSELTIKKEQVQMLLLNKIEESINSVRGIEYCEGLAHIYAAVK